MARYISDMPLWAVVIFIIAFLYGLSFIANPAKQAALKAGMTLRKARNIQLGIYAFFIIFLAYVSFFALKGTFDVNTLPPKVMVWAGLPLAVILFVFIGNTPLFKTLLRSITLESLISIHVFRLLGAFFILLYGYHLLPGTFAFFDAFGDMTTAIFAIPVARMVSNKHPWRTAAVVAWNIFGIMDIVNLLTIAIITSAGARAGAGASAAVGLREMTIFPFVWFPAFAPATILFLHTLVFRKLSEAKESRKFSVPAQPYNG